MTKEDLSSYQVIVRPALQGTYRGKPGSPPRKVYTTHAPTSGPAILHILNLLENYDLISEGITPLNIHRVVESLKCKSFLQHFDCLLTNFKVGFAAR